MTYIPKPKDVKRKQETVKVYADAISEFTMRKGMQ